MEDNDGAGCGCFWRGGFQSLISVFCNSCRGEIFLTIMKVLAMMSVLLFLIMQFFVDKNNFGSCMTIPII